MRWISGFLSVVAACGGSKPLDSSAPGAPAFPDSFQFGSATAGFQVEMGCPTWSAERCEDRASDWYDWVTDPSIQGDPSLFVSGEPVSAGPGMWETFEADVALMQADHHGAFRMSLEWSRIFPDPAAVDALSPAELAPLAQAEAVARYHEQLRALRDAGITPVVTLNHYVLPRYIHDGVACHHDPDGCVASGWVDGPRIVPRIAAWAGWAAQEFGGEVDVWFTLNEPFATTLSGYLQPGEDRSSPPGLSFDVARTRAVMLHQIEGHAAMVDAVRAYDLVDADGDGAAQQVGIVMNFVAIDPYDPESEADLRAVEHMDYLYHRLYLDAALTGAWDDDLDGVAETTRPELAGRLDLLGINYYNQVKVRGLPFPVAPEVPVFDFFPEFSWEPFPEGLGRVVRRGAEFGVPVWVTENGTPFVEDRGVEVLDAHLGSLQAALADGVDVRGYLYWSFVDNYEWNHGFDLRFGLYALDPATKARQARPVAARYREVARTRRLD